MNFKNKATIFIILIIFYVVTADIICAQEIFIYRPYLEKNPVSKHQKITLHGEYFGSLVAPGNFPGYNDLSGSRDRWNFGFQNIIFLGERTRFAAQLLTHDNGSRRTKFDWHFSLRHLLFDNLVAIIGHDSNHDSDFESTVNNKRYFVNRNYVGFGLPFMAGKIFFEPFTWFFHHTNQKGHLDYSGEKLVQEYGLRIGVRIKNRLGIYCQIISQSEAYFSFGQAILADLIVRVPVMEYLELSVGARIWTDIQESRMIQKQRFYNIFWGIAIPF